MTESQPTEYENQILTLHRCEAALRYFGHALSEWMTVGSANHRWVNGLLTYTNNYLCALYGTLSLMGVRDEDIDCLKTDNREFSQLFRMPDGHWDLTVVNWPKIAAALQRLVERNRAQLAKVGVPPAEQSVPLALETADIDGVAIYHQTPDGAERYVWYASCGRVYRGYQAPGATLPLWKRTVVSWATFNRFRSGVPDTWVQRSKGTGKWRGRTGHLVTILLKLVTTHGITVRIQEYRGLDEATRRNAKLYNFLRDAEAILHVEHWREMVSDYRPRLIPLECL